MQCNTTHVDGPNADLNPLTRTAYTWQACANQCAQETNCYVFSWNLNTSCSLFGIGTRQASMEGVWSGYTNRFWDPPKKLATPAFNVFSKWKSNALRRFTYSHEGQIDRVGGDLDDTSPRTEVDFDHCAQSCADAWDRGCRAFVWRTDQDRLHRCYRKFSINETIKPDNFSEFGFLSLINPDDSPLSRANLAIDDPRPGVYNLEPELVQSHQNLTGLCGESSSKVTNITIDKMSSPVWEDTRWRYWVTVNCWADRAGGDLYPYPHEASNLDYCAWLCWAQGNLNSTRPGSSVASDLALHLSASNGTSNGSNPDTSAIAGWCDGFAYNEKQHHCWLKFRTENISVTRSDQVAVGLLRQRVKIVDSDRQFVSTHFKARRDLQDSLPFAGLRGFGAENSPLRARKDRALMAPFPIVRSERVEVITDPRTGEERNATVSLIYTFSFEPGMDRVGSDMDESVNMTASSWDECSYRCAEVGGCGGFVWRNDTNDRPCQLKKKNGDGTETVLKDDNPNAMWSIAQVLRLSSSDILPSGNTLPLPEDSSPIYESNLAYPFDDVGARDIIDCDDNNITSFYIRTEDDGLNKMYGVEARASVECGKDRWGSEVADSPIEAPSFGYCAWVCYGKYRMNNKECVGFTFWPEKRQCYLKNPLPDQAVYTDDPKEIHPKVISGALVWRYPRGEVPKEPKKPNSPKKPSSSSSTTSFSSTSAESSSLSSSSSSMAPSTVFKTITRESIFVVTVSKSRSHSPNLSDPSSSSNSPSTPSPPAPTTESPKVDMSITPSKPSKKATQTWDPNGAEDRHRPNHWKSES